MGIVALSSVTCGCIVEEWGIFGALAVVFESMLPNATCDVPCSFCRSLN